MPFWDAITAAVSHPSSFNPITAISHGVESAADEFVTDVENTGEFISDETKKGIGEISKAARTTGKFVTNHPYETALIAGTVIVGVGLTVATGGLAGPEVAAVLGAEVGGEAAVGAAVGAEVGLGGFAAVEGAGVEALGGLAEAGIGPELAEVAEDFGLGDVEAFGQGAGGLPEVFQPAARSIAQVASQAELDSLNLLDPAGAAFRELASAENIEAVALDAVGLDSVADLGPAIAENPGLIGTISNAIGGESAMNLFGKVSIGATVINTIAGALESDRSNENAQKQSQKLDAIDNEFHKLENQTRNENVALNQLDGDFNRQLGSIRRDLGKGRAKMDNITKSLSQVVSGEDILNVTLGKETSEIRGVTDQLKILIKNNRSDAEAVQHNEIRLDDDLQKVSSEELKEVDELARIATTLDRPSTSQDFIKDLQSFSSSESKVEYIAENYQTFSLLSAKDIDRILDNLIDTGALDIGVTLSTDRKLGPPGLVGAHQLTTEEAQRLVQAEQDKTLVVTHETRAESEEKRRKAAQKTSQEAQKKAQEAQDKVEDATRRAAGLPPKRRRKKRTSTNLSRRINQRESTF